MAYILVRETPYNERERLQVEATVVGSGYELCETDSPRRVFTKERSVITLGNKRLHLSFSPDEGNDREHLRLLYDLKAITKVQKIAVDNNIDFRQLSAVGLEVSLEQ